MTPAALLAAAIAFAVAVAIGVVVRRRNEARALATTGGTWGDAGDRAANAGTAALLQRLEMAGFEHPRATAAFQAARIGFALLGACTGAWLGMTQFDGGRAAAYASLLGAVLGWQLPSLWLEGRVARRRIEIRADFPVMLDLLQISMQGGMGLHAAWSAAAASLTGAGESLAREMRRVDIAIGLGQPWGEALSQAAGRTGVEEFRSLGSLLGQTQRFGTGVADMIRVLCDSLRHDEAQGLEEQAHRRSVRMLTVLAGMLLPATLLIVVAPLLLMLFQSLEQVTSD